MSIDTSSGGHRASFLLLWATLMGGLLVLGNPTVCQGVSATQQPDAIVGSLRAAVAQHDVARLMSLNRSLQALGTAALPAIEGEMGQATAGMRRALVGALRGIPGDRATRLLVNVFTQEAPVYLRHTTSNDLSSQRYNGLLLVVLNVLRDRPVTEPVADSDLRNLISLVSDSSPAVAGDAARVLSRCEGVSAGSRLAPVLTRLRNEVVSPSRAAESGYLPSEMILRAQLLVAISDIGTPAISIIRPEMESCGADTELRQWLLLALGMAGDEASQADLKALATSEPNKYIRLFAVRAYSRAARQHAVPFLETLLNDTTQSDLGDVRGKNRFLIRDEARTEIRRWQKVAR